MICLTNCYATEYTLDDLFKITLERSEKIKISAEDLVIAEKTKDKAIPLLLPRLSADSSYTRFSDSNVADNKSYSQPLDRTRFELRLNQSATLDGKEFTVFRIEKQGIKKSKEGAKKPQVMILLTVENNNAREPITPLEKNNKVFIR